jgi:hypothetical protein
MVSWVCNDTIFNGAGTIDFAADDIACFEKGRRLHGDGHALGRSRRD